MRVYLQVIIITIFLTAFKVLSAQIVIQTSFDDYNTGNIEGQNNWDMVESGSATVVTTADHIKTGTQGVKMGSTSVSSVQLDHIAYNETSTGLSGNIFVDCWIKVITNPTEESIQFSACDLTPNGSERRAFQYGITTSGSLVVYDGGSKITVPSSEYTIGDWIRLSARIDYSTLKYEAAVNGTVLDQVFDFRESYDASTMGRETDVKEYHLLRFMYEDDISEIAIDDVYVGTDAISDIAFSAPSTTRTITIVQPASGSISLDPTQDEYEVGDTVIAKVSVPEHYKFITWTGSFTGTDNPLEIIVDNSATIGATVEIDPNDPPTEYTVTLTQTTGGAISVSPASGPYYEGATLTFTAVPNIGYAFDSWEGISGTNAEETITVTMDLTVSAAFEEGNFNERIVNVSSTSQFEDAIDDLKPGDRIVIADGTYSGASVGLKTKGGTASAPVIIEAANQGKATFTGSGQWSLENCAYITVHGLSFDVSVYTLFKLTGCNNVRLSHNVFKNTGSEGSKLILIGDGWDNTSCVSHHNRIDYNLFDTKTDGGAWLVIDGSHGGTPQVSQYDRIDHNHFRFNGPRATNEKETIRIGMSDLSLSSAFCTVENNYFEECDGDPEIISVKSCDNYVRNNTFVKCLGTVSLRHGDRTEVSGNFFLGQNKTATFEGSTIGCGGVRVYGKDHKVFNNYFEGLTGSKWDAACTLTCGDATNNNVTNSSDLTKHYLAENLEFTHNTLVNNESDIEIGYRSDWGKAPINCLIANNIIIQDSNKVVQVLTPGKEDGVSFAQNIFYTTGTATSGDITLSDDEAKNIDPGLELTNCRAKGIECDAMVPNMIYKLTSTSNTEVIDPTVTPISYVTSDSEGQLSVNARDIGADEFNSTSAITNGVLGSRYVGPDAIVFVESGEFSQYNITLTQTDGGVISINPANGPYYGGSTIILTALADEYYAFDFWTGISGTTTEESVILTGDLTVNATFIDLVSAHELEKNNLIKIMPNPFNGTTILKTNSTARVSVYTLQGKKVDSFEMVESYNWTAPSAGVYIGVITNGKNTSKVKLIAK